MPNFSMCVFTIDILPEFLKSLYTVLGQEDKSPLIGNKSNASRPHSTNHSAELERHVWKKYPTDMLMYENIMQHGGKLCW